MTTADKVREFINAGGTGTARSISAAIGRDQYVVACALRNMDRNREVDVIGSVVHDPTRPLRKAPVYAAAVEKPLQYGVSLVAAAIASRHPIEQAWAQRSAQ